MLEASAILDSRPASYREHLAITWLLVWRSSVFGWLIGAGIGFFLRLFLSLVGADQSTVQTIVSTVSLLLAFFVVMPFLVIPAMLNRKFKGFRPAIARD
jgi:hypothetical protein